MYKEVWTSEASNAKTLWKLFKVPFSWLFAQIACPKLHLQKPQSLPRRPSRRLKPALSRVNQFAAVVDFKSQLCRDAKRYAEKHTYRMAGESKKATTQVLLYEVAGVQQLEFLPFILAFQGFRAPLPFSTDTQQPEFIVTVDNAACGHCCEGWRCSSYSLS